jgi:hypothetical protein
MLANRKHSRKIAAAFMCGLAVTLLIFVAAPVRAQNRLQLKPLRGSSKVRLVYDSLSRVLDLDEALAGTNGTMPGEPPHRYTVWFTTQKDGFLYLVAKVCSASPISNPNAPCGGDRPCAILWIKVDMKLTAPVVQCEIYESCSYNYYDSEVKRDATGFTILIGGPKKKVLTYDNRAPEDGLEVLSEPVPARSSSGRQ